MNKVSIYTIIALIASLSGLSLIQLKPDWGFFGHRKINRMAVFTLPEEMLPLYKKYIAFVEEHAVDPDKRRYATKHEAVRHYIDLDQWGKIPFDNLAKDFGENLSVYSYLLYVNEKGDTAKIDKVFANKKCKIALANDTIATVSHKSIGFFYTRQVLSQYYEDAWKISVDSFNLWFKTFLKPGEIIVMDTFSQHGILPYYLSTALNKLTRAFEKKDLNAILHNSADIGHYIGDAHVPLHTTKNYNGQLSDQVGIHAFWESRIPELFSEEEFDFFAGKAEYIENPKEYFWNIVLASHEYVDEVLGLEKSLSISFPQDQQWCYDERLGQNIRIQCREYSRAYHNAMKGMVEERMVNAIQAIGSVWYTAWINAGQPDLKLIMDQNKNFVDNEEEIKKDVNIKTREHEGQ